MNWEERIPIRFIGSDEQPNRLARRLEATGACGCRVYAWALTLLMLCLTGTSIGFGVYADRNRRAQEELQSLQRVGGRVDKESSDSNTPALAFYSLHSSQLSIDHSDASSKIIVPKGSYPEYIMYRSEQMISYDQYGVIDAVQFFADMVKGYKRFGSSYNPDSIINSGSPDSETKKTAAIALHYSLTTNGEPVQHTLVGHITDVVETTSSYELTLAMYDRIDFAAHRAHHKPFSLSQPHYHTAPMLNRKGVLKMINKAVLPRNTLIWMTVYEADPVAVALALTLDLLEVLGNIVRECADIALAAGDTAAVRSAQAAKNVVDQSKTLIQSGAASTAVANDAMLRSAGLVIDAAAGAVFNLGTRVALSGSVEVLDFIDNLSWEGVSEAAGRAGDAIADIPASGRRLQAATPLATQYMSMTRHLKRIARPMHVLKNWENGNGFLQDVVKVLGRPEGQLVGFVLNMETGAGNALTGIAIQEAFKLHMDTCKNALASGSSISTSLNTAGYETIFNCLLEHSRPYQGNECQASCIATSMDQTVTPECQSSLDAIQDGCCCHSKPPSSVHPTCTTTDFSTIPFCYAVGAWATDFGCCLVESGKCPQGRLVGIWKEGTSLYQKCIGGTVLPSPSCTYLGYKSCGTIDALTGLYPISPINLCVRPNVGWIAGESYNDYCPSTED